MDEPTAQYATLGMGAMNVAMTFISLVLVEKMGRKTLMLIGLGGMFVDVVLLFLCINFKVCIDNINVSENMALISNLRNVVKICFYS